MTCVYCKKRDWLHLFIHDDCYDCTVKFDEQLYFSLYINWIKIFRYL